MNARPSGLPSMERGSSKRIGRGGCAASVLSVRRRTPINQAHRLKALT
jgi:hypothetical protein